MQRPNSTSRRCSKPCKSISIRSKGLMSMQNNVSMFAMCQVMAAALATPLLEASGSSAPPVRVGVLAGQTTLNKAQQVKTVADFTSGVFNVLVATTVAEEGLDIQQCSLVLRTELPSTIISNIQASFLFNH